MANRPGPPHSVPTLTEVVSWPPAGAKSNETAAAITPAPPDARAAAIEPGRATPDNAAAAESARVTADAAVAAELGPRVLADLQRQVDLMLEVRLREALAPLLARTADALVRDARNELAATLREMVARAVALELERQRSR